MMECPRCGFTQPKDRYCASCGLDVDHYVEKPKPLWIRLVQNPDFHLSLLVIMIVIVVGYIFYAQREKLERQVGALLAGSPLSSRDAGTPGSTVVKKSNVTSAPAPPPPLPPPPPAEAKKEDVKPLVAAESEPIAVAGEKLDVSHWEVSREALIPLLNSGAEKVSESTAGRAFLFAQGAKALEIVQAGRRMAFARTMTLQAGAQLTLETAPSALEAFQFGLYFQNLKSDTKEASIKWDSTLVLPTPDTPAETAAQAPVVKPVHEASLRGQVKMGSQAILLILYEPGIRSVREDFINKAGDGPWRIFSSEEFRAGTSVWVVLAQLK